MRGESCFQAVLQLGVLLGEEGPSPALLTWLGQPGPLQSAVQPQSRLALLIVKGL